RRAARRGGVGANAARSIAWFGTAPSHAGGGGDPCPLSLRTRATKLRGCAIHRQDALPVLLPRWSGSGTEYGEGREGARAKRAKSIDGFGTAPYPAAGSGDPFPLSLRSRGTKLRGGQILTVVPTGTRVTVALSPECLSG